MPDNHAEELLSEERRKYIFRALIEAQDQGMNVAQSREHICQELDITEQQLRQIEQEGLDQQWPPLEEDMP